MKQKSVRIQLKNEVNGMLYNTVNSEVISRGFPAEI